MNHGDDVKVEGCTKSQHERTERESYSKGKQHDDRLTVREGHQAVG